MQDRSRVRARVGLDRDGEKESERKKTAGYEVLRASTYVRRKEETSNAYAPLYESMSVKNLKADGKSQCFFIAT